MAKKITGYDLSRAFFNYCFENPGSIKPNDIALYFFIIEHCNRLGWKDKFGLPTSLGTESLGMSKNTYLKSFKNLVKHKFITVIKYSENQYSSNVIAVSNFNTAQGSARGAALDTATIQHENSEIPTTLPTVDTIDKPLTNNQETINHKTKKPEFFRNQGVFKRGSFKLPEKMQQWLVDEYDFQVDDSTLSDLNNLNQKIQNSFEQKNEDYDNDSIFNAFKFLVNNLSPWIKKNQFNPSYWVKSYSQIYQSLKPDSKTKDQFSLDGADEETKRILANAI